MAIGVGCSSAPLAPPAEPTNETIEFKLRRAASRWLRTPHRLGGLDRRGIDCSGLVKVLYDDLFQVDLPRTTYLQAKRGVTVPDGKWTAGDLIFFRPAQKGSHVGIYLANREFLHATVKRGVIISRLSESYWRDSYWKARRVLRHAPN